jgi:hypothetical protein
MLSAAKAFTIKNGEFTGDITAWQSGYQGGTPACVNSAGSIARAYSDVGYVGLFAKGSDVDVSGSAVTFYAGSGIFTMTTSTGEGSLYPYLSTATYVCGEAVGVTALGQYSNSYSSNAVRGRVLAVGSVSGGITSSLTLLMISA